MKNLDYDPANQTSIRKKAKRLEGRKVSESVAMESSDKHESRVITKGSLGKIIEKEYFKISPKNLAGEPDFPEAGLELKTTGIVNVDGSDRAKERLVLGMIDYESIIHEDFEKSKFMTKNETLLIIFYRYDREVPVIDQIVELADLWSIPKKDLVLIEKDWNAIKKMVEDGKAHLISESDTIFLKACTKGVNAKKARSQPNSNTKAKGRAFSLNKSYLSSIFQDMNNRRSAEESSLIIEDITELRAKSFEEVVTSRFMPYLGMVDSEIANLLKIRWNPDSKNRNDQITRGILKVGQDFGEMGRAGMTAKSICLEPNGRLVEHISFPAFSYNAILSETWLTSDLRDRLSSRFMFAIYRKSRKGNILEDVRFWSMPEAEIDGEAKRIWDITRDKIRKGRSDELPRSVDSYLIHVRPHANDHQDKAATPTGGKEVKKCFFIKNRYILENVVNRSQMRVDSVYM